MAQKVSIVYSGFWDFPLAFVVRHRDTQFYFRRGWDDAADDYEQTYRVYVLPNIPDSDVPKLWGRLVPLATHLLGTVPVEDVRFDPTHRKEIDTEILNGLLEDASPTET